MRENPPPPFDCLTCKLKNEHNCGNRFKLIDPVVQQKGLEPYPVWQAQDIKKKIPHTGKFPPKVWHLEDLKLYECPRTWITTETIQLIKLLHLEETPPKLFPGTWLDQPAWWLDVIDIYKIELAKYQRKK